MSETKKAIFPSSGPYSAGIVSGGFLFIAGQVGRNAEGKTGATIEEQTHFVIENLKTILHAAGCDFKDVVKTTVYITKQEYLKAYNPIYMEAFPEPRPARATVVASLVDDSFLIEIEAIAKIP